MTTRKQKALWVYANPSNPSFNQQIFEAGVKALGDGYDVETSDLYAMDFDARLSSRDLGTVGEQAEPGSSFVELTGDAFAAGQLPEEVQREQAKLAEADLLVLQVPLWWYGAPAMVKGWFDRVLTNGFAFGDDIDGDAGVPRRYGDGKFVGRRALIVVTAGEDAASIGPRGISGDIDSLLFPITHGTFWYMGMSSLPLHVITDADGLGAEDVEHEINRLVERLKDIDSESPVPFRKLNEGQYRPGRALNPEILPGRTDLGIHLHG